MRITNSVSDKLGTLGVLAILGLGVTACDSGGSGTSSGSDTSSDAGDGDAGDGDATSADAGDGDAGDGDTGDGDGDAGDGDGDGDSGTTGGDGDANGIVYIADPNGLFALDLADGSSWQVGDLYPEYTDDRVTISPDGGHVFFEAMSGTAVVDTASGANVLTEMFYTDGPLGWVDAERLIASEGIRVGIRSKEGVLESQYEPQSGGYGSRWLVSPDGSKFAVTSAATGRINVFPTSGSTEATADILLQQDCRAPTWLANGTMVGVCINTQEFYYAAESDSEATKVPLNAPEYDVLGSTIWTGDDTILVHLRANGTGGAVGHRFVVIDSTGTQQGDVDWLGEITSAGLLIRNIRLSEDESTVIWSDQGSELWRANIDGSGQEEFIPASAVVLEFDWSAGK